MTGNVPLGYLVLKLPETSGAEARIRKTKHDKAGWLLSPP